MNIGKIWEYGELSLAWGPLNLLVTMNISTLIVKDRKMV